MLDFLFKVILSSFFGAAIGFQRELKDRPAGLRTHTLVALASCVFTVASVQAISGGDPSRIASNVAVGIGFIGAGTIIKQGNLIIGLTTAASLWMVAAIGVLTGAGYYYHALISTLVGLFVLVIFKEVEEMVGKKRIFEFKLVVFSSEAELKVPEIEKELQTERLEFLREDGKIVISGLIRFKDGEEIEKKIKRLQEIGEIYYQKWQ